ncbi:hypothetical protein GCM10022210_02850 [Mucilaginibacter dorajii]|uniref:Uncharacterized protein n=1 Tax=Mucilaginibacter dorajii TaxID=692994 RepID=A0ABP7P5F6_9SPHI
MEFENIFLGEGRWRFRRKGRYFNRNGKRRGGNKKVLPYHCKKAADYWYKSDCSFKATQERPARKES